MPTHTRIRMFNTKETYPNQTLDNDLCQAVRAGNTVYVRGQVGTDFAGNLVGLGDPQAQAAQASTGGGADEDDAFAGAAELDGATRLVSTPVIAWPSIMPDAGVEKFWGTTLVTV